MGIPSFYFSTCASVEPNTSFLNRITGEWINVPVLRALFEAYGKTMGPDYEPFGNINFLPLYALADDSAVQNLTIGASGNAVFATRALEPAGGGTASIVVRQGGGNAIQLTDRQNNWDSINIMCAALNIDLSAHNYRITVNGRGNRLGRKYPNRYDYPPKYRFNKSRHRSIAPR